MPKCQYCGAELDDRYNFCLHCDRQVKCTNCGEMLVPNKAFCFLCAQPLASQTVAHSHANQFTLEEEQTGSSARRRIDGRLSDEAFREAAALFVGLTQRRMVPQPPGTPLSYEVPGIPPIVGDEKIENAGDESVDQQGRSSKEDSPATSNRRDGTRDEALKYFRLRGEDDVMPQEPGFKGKTKRQQQERFILLYAWAYKHILGRPVPSKNHFFDAARKHGVYDRNFDGYFPAIVNEYLVDTGEGFELNRGGDTKISEIVEEMNDSSAQVGFPYWKATSASGAKQSRLSKEDKEEVTRWVQMSVDKGKLDIRTLNSAANYAMFAIWALTKHLNVGSAVKPQMAYLFLTQKFKTVSVQKKSFQNVLSERRNKFRRNTQGLYYLTNEAEEEVKSWVETGQVGRSSG